MVLAGWAAALAGSFAGSFFKRRQRVGRLCGMLGTPANPGLPQPVEQLAHARDTAVFNPVLAPNQPLHVCRAPPTHAVFTELGWYADARLERASSEFGSRSYWLKTKTNLEPKIIRVDSTI
jgi:hypothetical protein